MAGNALPRTRLHLSADLKRELKLSGAKQLSSFRETVLEVGAIFVQGGCVGERLLDVRFAEHSIAAGPALGRRTLMASLIGTHCSDPNHAIIRIYFHH